MGYGYGRVWEGAFTPRNTHVGVKYICGYIRSLRWPVPGFSSVISHWVTSHLFPSFFLNISHFSIISFISQLFLKKFPNYFWSISLSFLLLSYFSTISHLLLSHFSTISQLLHFINCGEYVVFCVCICLFSIVVYCCIICCTIVRCFLCMCICSYMCMHVFCISGKEERPWPIARD